MKTLAIIISLVISLPSFGNLIENYPNNWVGNIDEFNQYESSLTLDGISSGSSIILYPYTTSPGFSIQSNVTLNYSPSNSNRFQLVLFTASEDLNLYSLILEIGESGQEDVFRLIENSEGAQNEIERGSTFFPNGDDSLNINMEYENDTINILIEDQLEISVPYEFQQVFGFLGINCIYTSSNSSNTTLYNLHHESTQIDEDGPLMDSCIWVSENQLRLYFNEFVDSCKVSSGFVEIDTFWSEEKTLNVIFEEEFEMGQEIEFWINVWDYLRNHTSFEYNVNYSVAKKFDVIFNEFMIDPTPSLGSLEESEYIELYNRSISDLNILNWSLVVNDDTIPISEHQIEKNGYVLFPMDNKLTNEGFQIRLLNQFKNVVDEFCFDFERFKNKPNSDGGWSLERKDVNFFGDFQDLWSYNVTMYGGTPLGINSNVTEITDVFEPYVNWVEIDQEGVKSFHLSEPVLTQEMYFDYTVESIENVQDYSGNHLLDTVFDFNFDPLERGDLKISEVLFNESDSRPEFLEITNISGDVKRIEQLFLAKEIQGSIIPIYQFPNFKLIQKNEIFVVTNDKRKLIESNTSNNKFVIIEDPQFPELLNTEMTLLLINSSGEIIDRVIYKDKWHKKEYRNVKGVSLERINLNSFGRDSSNWMTSSFEYNYASPGLINSQNKSEDDSFNVDLTSISISDFKPLKIEYEVLSNGNLMTLYFFNLNGQLLSKYDQLILLDREGIIEIRDWQELNSIRKGNYILSIEIQNQEKKKRKNFGFLKL